MSSPEALWSAKDCTHITEGVQDPSVGFGAFTPEALTMKPWQCQIIFTHSSFLFITESQNGLGGKRPLKIIQFNPSPHSDSWDELSLCRFISINEAQSLKNPKAEEWAHTPSSSTLTAASLVPRDSPWDREGCKEKSSIRQRWRYKASSTILN